MSIFVLWLLLNSSSEALPPHLYTDNPVLVHCQQQQTHHLMATDMQAGYVQTLNRVTLAPGLTLVQTSILPQPCPFWIN